MKQIIECEQAKTKRVICRCSFKGCKYVKAFNAPTEIRRVNTRYNTFLTCVASDSYLMRLSNDERCPEHPRHMMTVRLVDGKVNADHKCDARCTGAIGHTCECECGGENHGVNWL